MNFTPRETAPESDNLYYIKTTHGGYNKCIVIDPVTGSVLPNCTGYAWGRVNEITGVQPTLSRGDAQNWYYHTEDGYERGIIPYLGAVICFQDITDPNNGHVAVVEKINSDNSILVSESGYQAYYFRNRTLYPPYSYTNRQFQGFIYACGKNGGITMKKNRFNWVLFSNQAKSRKK